jgi:UDP-2,3-diacylglucosamine pyrophosphatase LpxH
MNNGMKVTYIRGNHDNFIDNFLKIDIHQIGNLELANEMVIEGINGKVYLVTHGDQFDKDISAWMYKVGSLAYDFLLFVNRVYNAYRLKRNMPYKSISQKIKQRSKMVTNFISKRQDRIIKLCKSKGYDGIITGHTHMPKATQITNSNIAENFIIDYMNSGDWVESKSAIVEKSNGEWGMISYRD